VPSILICCKSSHRALIEYESTDIDQLSELLGSELVEETVINPRDSSHFGSVNGGLRFDVGWDLHIEF
jgi:hypothetical protein